MTGNPFGVLANSQSTGDAQVQLVGDEEPQEVEVQNFGFLSLGRDHKVKVLPEGFTKDSLPRPWASLFAVANRRGLFAAAGPSSFVIGQTQSLREALSSKSQDYTPQLCIPSPIPISHIAFNADESHLILGGSNGVLMVYSIDALSGSGDSKAAIEVSTDGQELREVKPNPKFPELVAIVTMSGEVRMLDLNTRSYKTSADGSPILKTTVCTVAWSKMGKQIVCGMGDGTIWQMTPEGKGTAELPAPPGVENHFISSLLWLENHLFITTHTPAPTDGEANNESVFHTLQRTDSKIVYTKIADPAPPWGMEERSPPYFFTAQLQAYQPNLRNAIIFTGTCSGEVGVVARFSEQGNGVPADTFITAQVADDTRRAQMPLSAESTDSSPIGIALDLSAKDNVKRPVGGEEILESPGPLPIVMVLNYEGMIVGWHVVYNDAIEKGQKYEGMIIYEKEQAPAQPQSSTPAKPAASAFGQTSLGSPATASPFAAASTGGAAFGKPAFGQPAFGQTSAFGQPAAAPSSGGSLFGQPSTGTSSPWGSASQPPSTPKSSTPSTAFGQPSQLGAGSPAPAFGKPAFGAPAFGAPSQLGAKPAFGQPSSLAGSPAAPAFGKPAFGQTGFGSAAASPAPAGGSAFGSGSGFAAFANKGGFAAAASAQVPAGGSIFGSGKPLSAKTSSTDSASVFSTPTKSSGTGGFGSGAIDFKLSTAFKAEPSQAEDNAKPDDSGSLGGFGSMLGGALGGDSAPKSALGGAPSAAASSPFATPTKSAFGGLAANKSASPFAAAPAFATAGLSASNPFAQKPPAPAPSPAPKKSEEPESPAEEAPLPPDFTESKIEELPDEEEADKNKVPEAPLPPDITSRPAYTTGSTTEGTPNLPSSPESSPPASPTPEEAPLPPDFGPEIEEVPELPPALSDEEESEGADDEGEEEEGEESGEGEEEGEEEDEEEGEESEEEEGDEEKKENQTPHKPTGLFGATPPAKKPSTPGSASSIFATQGSLSERGINKNAPFSSLFEKKEDIPSDEEESEEEDEVESEEEARPKGRMQRKTPQKGMTRGGKPLAGSRLAVKNDERITSLLGEKKEETTGGIFGAKAPQKLEAPKPPTGLLSGPSEATKTPDGIFGTKPADKKEAAPKPGGGLFGFGAKPTEKPEASKGGLFGAPSKEVEKKSLFPSTDVASKPAPSLFGSQAPASPASKPGPSLFQKAPPSPTPSIFSPKGPGAGPSPFSTGKASPLSKPSTPFTAQPTPPTPEPAKEEPEIEEPESDVESVVDYDAEYSDQEDIKIREQLLHGPLKPSETLPEIQKLVPIDVPDEFNDVFDSIYISGNMMVNKLGQMARGLRSYHAAQNEPAPAGVKHESPEDMKPADTWHLAEMGVITKNIDILLRDVREINAEKPLLEEKRQVASKGFIKLNTMESEIKRVLAVHNDPTAAAQARARLLAPEQQLQQRALRKSFTRVEKALKEAEYKATMFKAKLASRDRHRSSRKLQPPTAEAVRTTVMKLTAMAEKKNRDVGVLEERLRRLRLGAGRRAAGGDRSFSSVSFGGGTTPEPMTPARMAPPPGMNSSSLVAFTPVMALVEEGEIEEAVEERRRRREAGRKLKGALLRMREEQQQGARA